MKSIASPACVILPFPRQNAATRAPHPAGAFPDLMQLAAPVNPHAPDAVWLLGENILLPSTGGSGFRYAACVHVVTDRGHKALPVISRRIWSQPPLSSASTDHAVWAELGAGLVAASQRVAETALSLHGAVSIARAWAGHHLTAVAPQSGSALLLGSSSHVLCEALPLSLSVQSPIMARILPFVDPRVAMPTLLAA